MHFVRGEKTLNSAGGRTPFSPSVHALCPVEIHLNKKIKNSSALQGEFIKPFCQEGREKSASRFSALKDLGGSAAQQEGSDGQRCYVSVGARGALCGHRLCDTRRNRD